MEDIDIKIKSLLDQADFLTLCTCVDGNPSGANVYFANDGFDLYFFTFNSSRKAEQIRFNPRVQCVVRPDGLDGIRELQIDAYAEPVRDLAGMAKARELILKVTAAFKDYMDDEFLLKNKVIGYYKIKPTVIKYVDFYAPTQFEWREFPEHRQTNSRAILVGALHRAKFYLRAVRAPFFTASLGPLLLGAAVAFYQFGQLHWPVFWWSLLGVILAHAGANVANDYGDHLSRNDEYNQFFTPFNGGSRMIQAGLMSVPKMLVLSSACFCAAIMIGLHLNNLLHGSFFTPSPLLWTGVCGIALGVFYTLGPVRLSYIGWGDVAVMLGFGPVIVLGAHYVQQQILLPQMAWSPLPALLASVPLALLVGLILFINSFQDYQADRAVGKRTWVVRTAEGGDAADYRKPFRIYTAVMLLTFAYIVLYGAMALHSGSLGTPWVWLALLAGIPAYFAIRQGRQWLAQWESPSPNRRHLLYQLIPVNVLTIGTHLAVGVLLTLGFLIGRSL